MIWTELTDEQAWEALLYSPKMGGRWSRLTSRLFRRRDPEGDLVAEVRLDNVRGEQRFRVRVRALAGLVDIGDTLTAQEALDLADEHLRRKGWRLLQGGDLP